MDSIRLGAQGPRVSRLGLGCESLTVRNQESEQNGIATIHAALDSGLTFLDTADFYGSGESEMLLGKALRGRRDQAFLSVKFGMQMTPGHQMLGMDGRPESVKNYATYSLRRLGVEVIDLYQPARPDPKVPWEETIGAVADLIQQGYVRYLGVSEVGADLLRRAHKVHPVTALEIEYSLACRFIETQILPTARELGIGIVPYRTLANGLLSGAMNTEPVGPMTPPRCQGENLRHNLAKVEVLKAMAARKGFTAAQVAIAWLTSRGPDILPLVGASRPSRIQDNLASLDVQLSAEEWAELDLVFAPGEIRGERYPLFAMKWQAQ